MGPVYYVIYVALLSTYASASTDTNTRPKDSLVEQLNEDNWDRMLTGEWMVEFYAPWCPACRALEPVWEDLALSKKKLNINVGKIDVTNSPGLSGRFLVTALPTIYHVNNGIFRQYKSPRDKSSLIEFVSEKTWMKVDPISSWKSPTSFHMSFLSQFFKLSQILRNIHNQLLEDVGVPVWGVYLIFAAATVVSGTILGLLIVCLVDFLFPPSQQQGKMKQTAATDGATQEKNSDEDEIVENIGGDLIDEEESETEEPEMKESEAKKSETKKSETKEVEASETDKDSKADTSSPNVRKRKPRKAD
ncbi:PREDICTED: thioredoxin-related transmembrane protein 1-like [Cyphomyrmex costatus]|uniref:Thioredoxin-related transmembrane protein 1 n=1 Tax=Cyphomyrmex costatus TaxID=456900 RepID=A0A151K2H0_9HYME|nr:PREDICTED: thioredoxin-related transmembrane protein 1-like [Cyphomyrmex costatus]KYN50191.1 Thioredoxin-related transmembrane protein 1 [Cyphomyrmex costatus]